MREWILPPAPATLVPVENAERHSISVNDIPHRPPFSFVDEIVEVDDRRIVTRWVSDGAAAFFRGHYPNRPIVPGVLLCECCFQAGALLIVHRVGGFSAGWRVPVVTRISDARFKRMVGPGQTLRIEVTLDEELEGAFFFTGRVTVENQLVARVGFACMAAEE